MTGEFEVHAIRYAHREASARGESLHLAEPADTAYLLKQNLAGRVSLVDGEYQVLPGITTHKPDGHTTDLQVVRVRTASGHVVLAANGRHFYDNIGQDRPYAVVNELPAMYEAFDTIRALADDTGLIVPGTDRVSRQTVGERENVQSDVYEWLRADIVSGEFEAGAPLVELALAERYGSSRTPVREALRSLVQDGLVERGDRGMRVRVRSPEEILEIYEVRISLEAIAASSAAARYTDFDLIQVQRAQAAMDETPTDDPSAMAAANRAVHEAIWAASHNGTIVDLLTRLNNHLTRYPATTLSVPERWPEALREHHELIVAIQNRNADKAAELAQQHMTKAREIRLQIYREQ